jgi:1,4-dihydroxy-2-naphthoyl-CoA hydrolase
MDRLANLCNDQLPFAKLLGIEIISAAPASIVAHMTVREHLCTRPAVLHGGAIMSFADTLGALGAIANLNMDASTVTIESKTNFVGSAPLGARLTATAVPVHLGHRTMVWQTRITTQEGRIVAVTTQTQLVLRPVRTAIRHSKSF